MWAWRDRRQKAWRQSMANKNLNVFQRSERCNNHLALHCSRLFHLSPRWSSEFTKETPSHNTSFVSTIVTQSIPSETHWATLTFTDAPFKQQAAIKALLYTVNVGIRASATLELHTVLQGSSAGMRCTVLIYYVSTLPSKKGIFNQQFLQTTSHLAHDTICSSRANVFDFTRWRAHSRGPVLGITGEKLCTVNRKRSPSYHSKTKCSNKIRESLCTQLKTSKNKRGLWKDRALQCKELKNPELCRKFEIQIGKM